MLSILGASLSYFVLHTALLFLQCNCSQCSLTRALQHAHAQLSFWSLDVSSLPIFMAYPCLCQHSKQAFTKSCPGFFLVSKHVLGNIEADKRTTRARYTYIVSPRRGPFVTTYVGLAQTRPIIMGNDYQFCH